VAKLAIGGESRCQVSGIGRIRIILCMTVIAIAGRIFKASRSMAAVAVLDVMSGSERKERMAESCSTPGIGIHLMTEGTVGAEVPLHMVWVRSGLKL